jgi:hypothetical protein
MPKPISYYLSNMPNFPLEPIERLSRAHRVDLSARLLALSSSPGISKTDLRLMTWWIAEKLSITEDQVNQIGWRQRVELANAISMVAVDEMALEDIQPF